MTDPELKKAIAYLEDAVHHLSRARLALSDVSRNLTVILETQEKND